MNTEQTTMSTRTTHTIAMYEGLNFTAHCGLEFSASQIDNNTIRAEVVDSTATLRELRKITCRACMSVFLAQVISTQQKYRYTKLVTVFSAALGIEDYVTPAEVAPVAETPADGMPTQAERNIASAEDREFTMEDALSIQAQGLAEYRTVLNDAAYTSLVEHIAVKNAQGYTSPYHVFRGQDFASYISGLAALLELSGR
jgi:hypothetical protein